MPKIFTSEKQKIGKIGENVAAKFLVKHGFLILDKNYTKKWGELDIVAEKKNKLYFIEVKSITRNWDIILRSKIDEKAQEIDTWRAEDNMHPWKLKRMSRIIQTYLLSKKIPDEKEWEACLLVVYLDLKNKKARVKVVEDIIL
ncbi:MAG: YraN family protein [Patescibacteria group bacterium]